VTAHDGYIRAFRERAAREREAILESRRRAGEAAERAVRAVIEEFHPARVLLIGSLPRGTFRPGSDIDLAVEGLSAGQCEAAERSAREAAGLPVDVRRLESMDPGWRAHHLRFAGSCMSAADPQAPLVAQLRDELRLAREALARLATEGAAEAGRHGEQAPSTVTVHGCGAIVHAFYTALERFLQAAARDFNSEPPQGPDWHRRLLIAASSERPGRRPPILAPETAAALDRYLRFRHLFRNLYVFDLDWSELLPLLRRLPEVHSLVDRDLARFDGFLAALTTPPD